MQDIVAYNNSILEKIDALLQQLTDEELKCPSRLLFGSSIGQHFRHLFEFYPCLLTELNEHPFSYPRRHRHLLIETEVLDVRASPAPRPRFRM